MDIKVVSGEITKFETGAIIVGMFEGEKRLGRELGVLNRKWAGLLQNPSKRVKSRESREVNVFHSSVKYLPLVWAVVDR